MSLWRPKRPKGGPKTRRGRVTCPVCGRTVGLTAGGNIAYHLDTRSKGRSGYPDDCPGSGSSPS